MSYSTDGSGMQQAPQPSGSSGLPNKPQWGVPSEPQTPEVASSTDERENRKKDAINNVLAELKIAQDAIFSTPTKPSGGKKSEALIDGLGKGGKLWQSTLAETVRKDLAGPIDDVEKKVSDTVESVKGQYNKEPEKVKPTDERASW